MDHLRRLLPELRRSGQAIFTVMRQPPYRTLFLAMICFALLVCAMDVTTRALRVYQMVDLDKSLFYLLSTDRGLPEITGYFAMGTAATAMLVMLLRSRSPVYLFWVVLLFYLIADDYFKIHEFFGDLFSATYPAPVSVMSREDIGQVIYSATAAFIALSIFLVGYGFSSWRDRALSLWLLIPFGGLAFFGVFLDAVHALFEGWPKWIPAVFAVTEDGGELVCMWLILVVALAILRAPSKTPYAAFAAPPSGA